MDSGMRSNTTVAIALTLAAACLVAVVVLLRSPAGASSGAETALALEELRASVDQLAREMRELRVEHLFWSVRDVLVHYGPPSQISHTGVLWLIYRSSETRLKVSFAIESGFVIWVNLST